jgi:hypothetical protein
MKIAIPTYKRAGSIEHLTLRIVRGLNYPIYLFVNSEEDKKEYEKIKGVEIVVSNVKGIAQTRNFILDYFGAGEKVIQLDDDLQDILILKNGKLEKLEGAFLEGFIEQAFSDLEKEGLKLWGVYPVPNHFYMDRNVSHRNFIIGSFCGVIVSGIRYAEIPLKEDYDFTLSHLLDGGVIRYNFITVKAKHYTNKGGAVDVRNAGKVQASIDYLKRKWGKAIANNPRRENEILLRPNYLE